MKRLLVFALLLVVACSAAEAQVAVYGAFQASDYHVANIGYQYGSMLGAYWDPVGVPFVKGGVDLRASWIGSGNATDDSYMLGPRIQLHPHILPLMPYAEALGGISHVVIGQGAAHTAGNKFSYALVAGLDMTIFPRLDWRVIDYSWGKVENLGDNFQPRTISTGLVLRLP